MSLESVWFFDRPLQLEKLKGSSPNIFTIK